MAATGARAAALSRLVEWAGIGVVLQALTVFGAVAAGAWAARRRVLDEPGRHLRLLTTMVALGLSAAVLGGLPIALLGGQFWTTASIPAQLGAGAAHALGGYLGGLGFAAAFGLIAHTAAAARHRLLGRALIACGQRSLSCYLLQSVVFVPLLPAWTLGLGASMRLWQGAALAAATWLVSVILATGAAQLGHRGPAELLLRRLTYRTPARHPGSPQSP